MKKILLLSMIAVQGLVLQAQNTNDKEPLITRSFAGKSFQQLVSETSGGNITVTGGSGEARVELFVWPSNREWKSYSNEQLQQKLNEEYDVVIEIKGNTLTASAKPKEKFRNWNNSLSISFRIYVPQQTATTLRTSGGNIVLTNLSGTQDFVTSGGNLRLDQLSGKIKGRTSGGNISLINCKNDLDLTTSGGNIDAEKTSGHLRMATSGGNITMTDLDGTVDATTSGGNVRANSVKGSLEAHTSGGHVGLDNISGSVDASTSGGNISVSLKETGEFVKLSNSGGHIDLELPGNKGLDLKLTGGKIKTSKLSNFDGTFEEDRIIGKLNGGGTPVTVRAGGGRLNLTIK